MTGNGALSVIPYGATELADTRFALSPLSHLIHGVHGGPCSTSSTLRERWWATARRHIPQSAIPVVQLINSDPTVLPGLISPTPTSVPGALEPDFDEEVEQLAASCGVGRFRLPSMARDGKDVPVLARELAEGSPVAVAHLADGLRALFQACMASDWPGIRNQLHGDLTSRTQQMMTNGPGYVLRGLNTKLKWEQDWLVFGGMTVSDEFRNAEGGLTLMPCAFGSLTLHPQLTPTGRRVLVYSVKVNFDVPGDVDGLATLIGIGRARTLRALTKPASTSELAQRLGVAVPTASVHATVLRRAGLIVTRREGRQVCHEITAVGAALLAANPRSRIE